MDYAAIGASWFLVPIPTLMACVSLAVTNQTHIIAMTMFICIYVLIWICGLRYLFVHRDHGLRVIPKLWRAGLRAFPFLCVAIKIVIEVTGQS
jgi:uncharacterized membrane protein